MAQTPAYYLDSLQATAMAVTKRLQPARKIQRPVTAKSVSRVVTVLPIGLTTTAPQRRATLMPSTASVTPYGLAHILGGT